MADPTVKQRQLFAKMGYAMPDGSYYIRPGAEGASDLENAIKAVGRGEAAGDSGAAIRKHIMKRAADLKLSDKIPDTWDADGTLKQMDPVDAFLEHHGVKGMHWGHRKGREDASADHTRVSELHARVKANGGTHVLTNPELKDANERLNLEQQYARLTDHPSSVSRGYEFVKTAVGVGKTGVDAVETGKKVHKIYKEATG